MKLLRIALLGCLSITGVKAQHMPVATSDNLIYKGCVDTMCQLEINFASIGSGIDGDCYVKVEAYLNKKKLEYSAKSVGREGETRICVPQLPQLKKHKHQIVKDLRKILSCGQWVSMNVP